MSTVENEVKTAVTAEEASLHARVAALEAKALAWWTDYRLYAALAAGVIAGAIAARIL